MVADKSGLYPLTIRLQSFPPLSPLRSPLYLSSFPIADIPMPASAADAIFWIAVACCSVAQLAIIRSVLISQSRMAAGAASDVAAPTSPTSLGRRVAELAWAVLPGVALVVLFLVTWRAMHEVHVTAQVVASVRP
jgi:heme/copper-type cytochrome/quinol oxidase subunit 2